MEDDTDNKERGGAGKKRENRIKKDMRGNVGCGMRKGRI